MPYRRRRYSRRRKTGLWHKKVSAAQVAGAAMSAYRGVKYLRGLVNSERMHLINSATFNPDSSGDITHLTNIGQNDTATGRTGNSVLLRDIFYRFQITGNASATGTFYRIILFQDKQQIGDTSPTVADVLNSIEVQSPLNSNTAGRFKILKDYYFSTNQDSRTRTFKNYIKLHSHIRYNGSTANDIQKNGIYLLMLSNEATNTPTFTYNIKMGWHDN